MLPEAHISDAELMLALDGELAAPRAAMVQQHLAHCWECRLRRSRFEQAIAGYLAAHGELLPLEIPPAEGPAAKLRATLRQPGARPATAGGWLPLRWRLGWRLGWPNVRPMLAGLALLLLAPLAVLLWLNTAQVHPLPGGPLPDPRLTPGAVRLISARQVCLLSPGDEGRLAPPPLAARVFSRYRIVNPKPRSFEVDYLISPALGGSSDIENLWPVPYADGLWTSRVKDALEDRLRALVCAGQVDLATAQHELASNWIAAYRKYFRTKEPIASHALFVKDSPWE